MFKNPGSKLETIAYVWFFYKDYYWNNGCNFSY